MRLTLVSAFVAALLLAAGVRLDLASAAQLLLNSGPLPYSAEFTCPAPDPEPPPEPIEVTCS
jgi:hypothetical protein